MLGVRPGLPACYYVPASSALPVCCLQIIVALITLAKVSRPRHRVLPSSYTRWGQSEKIHGSLRPRH